MKPIYIFILCYNEEKIVNETIKYYRNKFPDCIITIFDNDSTDNSVAIAKSLNCNIYTYFSNNTQDDFLFSNLKNRVFKQFVQEKPAWVFIVDMDEWLDIDQNTLEQEELKGTTILSVKGYNMIGESKSIDLKDIDITKINKCVESHYYNKNVCFLYPLVSDINYGMGAHSCNPVGVVKFSENIYKLKHMKYLGLEYMIDKNKIQYARSHEMRKLGHCIHYYDNVSMVINEYNNLLNRSTNYEDH